MIRKISGMKLNTLLTLAVLVVVPIGIVIFPGEGMEPASVLGGYITGVGVCFSALTLSQINKKR